MKRLTLAGMIVSMAFPASALAGMSRGYVLSVDKRHHTIQVVDSRHVVHAYRYHGRLPMVHLGSKISFDRAGRSISHVRLTSNRSWTVSYYARVVRAGKHGLVLRLPDGRTVGFGAKQINHRRLKRSLRHRRHHHAARAADVQVTAGGVTINILGLQPGVTVLVTETVDDQGNVTITITIPPTPAVTGEQSASGVVGQVDTDAFDLLTGDGSLLRLHMAADQLAAANLQTCDTANVTYHQDGELLIADTVQTTGTSTLGDCAPDQAPQDVIGTITQVDGNGLTIADGNGGSETFSVDDPSITDGFVVGDVVDVTYSQLSDGSLDASDVEYVEQDASGVVTSVSDGNLTITDDQGNSDTFSADPASGMFDGVALGDYVDVTYHTSAGGNVADSVDDQSSDWGGGDWGFGGFWGRRS
jgi:hypothetical protein